MMNWGKCLYCVFVFGAAMAVGQDASNTEQHTAVREEIVVKGTKSDVPLRNLTRHAVVVTAAEMETHQWRTVADVLVHQPGISLVRNGVPGSVTTVFVRGAKSENVVVLRDGVRINDPSGPGRGFDFANLSTHGVERIELVLGPQTTLYGTDAAAGVINIVTKRGQDQTQAQIGLEGSDEDSLRLNGSLSGGGKGWRYSAGVEFNAEDAFSSRMPQSGQTFETDEYEQTMGYLNLDAEINEAWQTGLAFNTGSAEVDIDAFDGDDPNAKNSTDYDYFNWQLQRRSLDRKWDVSLHVGFADTHREGDDPRDEVRPNDALTSRFDGETTSLELRSIYRFSPKASILAGLWHQQEDASGFTLSESAFGPFESRWEGDTDTTAAFADLRVEPAQGLGLNLALRHDEHSIFDGETTYQAGVVYQFPGVPLRLNGAYGTAFKAPSVFQLFSAFGNQSLQPEESEALEVGLSLDFADKNGSVSLHYFQNEYEQLIEFFFDPVTFESLFFNLDSAENSGFEAVLNYAHQAWRFKASFESQDPENTSDPSNIKRLIRRFEDKASLQASWSASKRLTLFGNLLHYGHAYDTDFAVFPAEDVALDSYTLVNLGAAYRWREASFNLRVENLSDETYTQVLGFSSPGRRIYGGVHYRF